MCPDNLFGHLAATAIPGVEEWRDGAYRRTLRLPHGPGIVSLRPGPEYIACQLALTDLRDLAMAISRCRRLLDLDADPVAVCDQLRAGPALRPLIDKAPGRRVPRTVDAAELAVRAVIGQQVSTGAARTHGARLAQRYGEPVDDQARRPDQAVSRHGRASPTPTRRRWPCRHAAPDGDRAGPGDRLRDGRPRRRRRLGPGQEHAGAVPGIGPWTIELVAMRGLGDPDAFTATDLGVRQAAAGLGLPGSPAALIRRAEPWRPWRGYAVQYLWATSDHAINQLPAA